MTNVIVQTTNVIVQMTNVIVQMTNVIVQMTYPTSPMSVPLHHHNTFHPGRHNFQQQSRPFYHHQVNQYGSNRMLPSNTPGSMMSCSQRNNSFLVPQHGRHYNFNNFYSSNNTQPSSTSRPPSTSGLIDLSFSSGSCNQPLTMATTSASCGKMASSCSFQQNRLSCSYRKESQEEPNKKKVTFYKNINI